MLVAIGAGVVIVQRDAGPAGQPLDSVDKIEMLGLAHEGDGVTTGLAPEAVIEPLGGVDVERAGLLGVERAEADHSGPHPA